MTAPWLDRSGRLMPLKLATFVGLFLPAAWIVTQAAMGWLGPKLVTELIHRFGDWTVYFLLLSLMVTPLRRIAQWPKLIAIRRMVGVTALAYALVHFSLYIVDQQFKLGTVFSEIVLRFYLTIGFVALLGLATLGATSTDGMIRRLGGARWNKLHKVVYALAVLALWHYLLQSKLDVTAAVLMGGFFVWEIGVRLMVWRGVPLNVLPLTALAIVTALLTALFETGWYAARTGAPALRVLSANLDFDIAIRPAWWVLAAGLAVAALALVRATVWKPATPSRRRDRPAEA